MSKKFWIVLTLCAIAIAAALLLLAFQREKGRRRHQIGQLWSLVRFYYAPAHTGHYPNDLAELRSLPMYSPYFERAIHEIELTAPGIDEETVSSNTIVLKERTVDRSGGMWVHYVDGVIVYRPGQTR